MPTIEIAELLVGIQRAFKPLKLRWYVFGAQAVIAAGAVRATAGPLWEGYFPRCRDPCNNQPHPTLCVTKWNTAPAHPQAFGDAPCWAWASRPARRQ